MAETKAKAIELRKTRDFSLKFNVTFDFLRQEFKPLMRGMIYISGPVIAIAAVLGAYYQKNALSLFSFTFEDPEQFFNDDFILSAVGLLLSSILAYVVVLAVVIEYARLYAEKGNQSVEVNELWLSVKDRLWGYFGSAIGYTLIFVAVLFAGGIIIALLISTNLFFLTFIAAFAFVFLILFASCWNYMAIIGYNLEENGFIENINRSIQLLRNNWWKTVGLVMVGSLMVYIAGMVFAIPNSVIAFSTAFHSIDNPDAAAPSQTEEIVFALTAFIASAGGYFLNVVFTLLVLVQYLNLVEIRDASGLIQRIQGIGTENEDKEGEDF